MTEHTSSTPETVVGVFTHRTDADNAIESLHRAGFTDKQIGFVTTNNNPSLEEQDTPQELRDQGTVTEEAVGLGTLGAAPLAAPLGINQGNITGVTTAGPFGGPLVADELMKTSDIEESTDPKTGAAKGAVRGGIIGGILGAAASLLVPGIGPAIAGGILAATLGGAAFGALTGGFIGSLTGMGISEEDAHYYQSEVASGRTLMTIKAGSRAQEALSILRENGAYDAGTRRSSLQQ